MWAKSSKPFIDLSEKIANHKGIRTPYRLKNNLLIEYREGPEKESEKFEHENTLKYNNLRAYAEFLRALRYNSRTFFIMISADWQI